MSQALCSNPVGPFLEDPGQQRTWDYDATPANSITFGSTAATGFTSPSVDRVCLLHIPANKTQTSGSGYALIA